MESDWKVLIQHPISEAFVQEQSKYVGKSNQITNKYMQVKNCLNGQLRIEIKKKNNVCGHLQYGKNVNLNVMYNQTFAMSSVGLIIVATNHLLLQEDIMLCAVCIWKHSSVLTPSVRIEQF